MSAKTRTTVTVADDHPVVLAGVRSLLAACGKFDVVAAVSDGAAALAALRTYRPTLAVLDMTMPGMTGLDVIRGAREEALPTRIVLLTASLRDDQIAAAVDAGAWGLMLKDAAGDDLVDCLLRVREGEHWLPASMVEPALVRHAARQREEARYEVTPREREIAILVARGLPNKLISRETGIAEGTVKIHLHNIYQKLGVENRTALAALARRHWIGDQEP